MKLFASLLVSFAVSTAALAGTENDDPVVRQVRAAFATAHVPSVTELQPDTQWRCLRLNGLVHNTGRHEEGLTFRPFGTFVNLENTWTFGSDTPAVRLTMAYDNGDLVDAAGFWYFRIADDGTLLGEITGEDDPSLYDPSQAVQGRLAIEYFYCPVFRPER